MNKFEKDFTKEKRRENTLEQEIFTHCPDIPKDFLEKVFSEKPHIKQGLEALRKYPDQGVTFKHSLKTANLVYLVATEKYSQEPEKTELLVATAFAHDLGKLKVNPDIINFPGKIKGDDLAELQNHVEGTFEHLKKIGDLKTAKIALLHHRSQIKNPYPSDERMAQLFGGEVITEEEKEMGNILAMADFFEALSSDRSYKKGQPPEVTEKFMRQDFGSNVDEKVLEILKQNYARLYKK